MTGKEADKIDFAVGLSSQFSDFKASITLRIFGEIYKKKYLIHFLYPL